MGGCTLGKFNSMGGGHMNLSDYMGGRGLWKFNSMGGGVEKKVPSSPPQVFFSGIALICLMVNYGIFYLTAKSTRLKCYYRLYRVLLGD